MVDGSTAELVRACGPMDRTSLRDWRVNRNRECPICGARKGCLLDPSPTPAVAICVRNASAERARGRMPGWVHWLVKPEDRKAGSDPVIVPSSPKPVHNPDRRDVVYRAILGRLRLSERHRAELAARELEPEQITRHGYKTLPLEGRARLCRDLIARFGQEALRGIPGLYVKRGGYGDYWTLAGSPGLLIPVRDEQGRIVGLRIRVDDPQGEGKYRWLSSDGKPGGTGSGSPVHIATPKHNNIANGQKGDYRNNPLWITEGEFKANIAADHLDVACISVPGVSSWRGAVEAAQTLRPDGGTVVVAYDMDWPVKPEVLNNLSELVGALGQAAYRVEIATWDRTFKGLDDLLAASGTYDLVDATQWIAQARGMGRLAEIPAPPATAIDLPAVTLQDAQDLIRAEIRQAVRDAAADDAKGQLRLFADSCGVGKTSAVRDTLVEMWQAKEWPTVVDGQGPRPLRVLIACDAAAENGDDGEPINKALDLARSMPPELAMYQAGRNADNCLRIGEVHALGQGRHNTMAHVCAHCKDRCESEGRPFACDQGNGYLAQVKRADLMPVVTMHKARLFSRADEAKDFDLVVIDEDLAGQLAEHVVIDRAVLDTWLAELDRVAAEHPHWLSIGVHRDLMGRMQQALAAGLTDRTQRTLIDALGAEAHELIRQCNRGQYKADPHTKAYRHELPTTIRALDGIKIPKAAVPLRAWRDLLIALLDDLDRPSPDSTAWLVPAAETKAGAILGRIVLVCPYDKPLKARANGLWINLDATPDLPTLRMIWPNHLRVIRSNVAGNVEIRQATNSQYTREQDETSQRTAEAVIANVLDKTPGRVAFIGHKAMAEEIAATERLAIGWFGYDDRCHNRYADCDTLILWGLHHPPLDLVERHVRAWRRWAELPTPELRSTGRQFVPYQWSNGNGQGLAASVPVHPDPDVQAALDYSWAATVEQAIGRLRAVRKDKAVTVYLCSSRPIPELQIAQLFDVHELLGRPKPGGRVANVIEHNLRREAAAIERRRAALPAAGEILAEHPDYGRPRLLAALRERGLAVNDRDVRWLLTQLDAQCDAWAHDKLEDISTSSCVQPTALSGTVENKGLTNIGIDGPLGTIPVDGWPPRPWPN